jgi:dUTP pyrophosphatase
MQVVKVKKMHKDAVIPSKAYLSDAGFDLSSIENVVVRSGETLKIKTGLAFELPGGYEIQVRPRSGMSMNTKLRVLFGTVDSDYRGEVAVIVDNIGFERHIIKKGERIAQAIIQRIPLITLEEVAELNPGSRGVNGFGSTGV